MFLKSNILDSLDRVWLRAKFMMFGILICMFYGLLNLYSISNNSGFQFFYKQIGYWCIGFLIVVFLLNVKSETIYRMAPYVYVLSIVLLVLVMIIGKTSMGAQRWIKIGFLNIQPSEFAKIGIVLMMAYVSDIVGAKKLSSIYGAILMGIIFVIPVGLILMQPDLTTAFIIFALGGSIIFVNGIKAKYLFFLCSILMIASPFAVASLKDYQRMRIVNFINPYSDPSRTGYNAIQSIVSVGSGGLFGSGFMHGKQAKLRFLPEAHTDFVFASISEEFGFVGSMFLVFAFACIVLNCILISLSSVRYGVKIMSFGCAMYFFLNAAINMGMNIGLLPIAGVPMPFVSYGGSSLLTSLAFCGIVISVSGE